MRFRQRLPTYEGKQGATARPLEKHVSGEISCVCSRVFQNGQIVFAVKAGWLILIAVLTVSVGFNTPHSTQYKGKSGEEVRETHGILIYCPPHCITDHIIHRASVCRPF